jgi:hypothetical protein
MTKMRIAGVLCILALFATGCATTTSATGGVEKLHGTWANKEYFGTYWTHTFTIYPDGRELWWDQSAVDMPSGEARFVIEKKWMDGQGNTWYRLTERGSYLPYNEEVAKANPLYSLMKIDATGKILELENSKADFPATFGALGGTHFIYFRRL